MAVKIFAKISYNINGVASPSFTVALAWTNEPNEIDSDERKLYSFLGAQSFPFFMGTPMLLPPSPDTVAHNFPIDKSPDEILSMFGLPDNEKYPLTSYIPVIGYVGDDMEIQKLAFIMNNLASMTSQGVSTVEPAEVFFYIHKLTTAEIDDFANSYPELNTVDASVTDLYDLLLPHVATKNNALEADGYRQATQRGSAIVFYADCINYLSMMGNPPIDEDMPK